MNTVVDVAVESGRLAISRSLAANAVRAVLRSARVRRAVVSVTFVNDRTIARLNRRHLGRRGATDVIAFGFAQAGTDGAVMGDVYIAVDAARRSAQRRGPFAVREELVRLVVHGTLHVLGFDHPEDESRVDLRYVAAPGTAREARAPSGPRMSMAAWVVAAGGAALAAVTAAADGALAAPECRAVPGADDAHRALAMTRVLAYLALGAGVGRGVLRGLDAAPALSWLVVLALVAGVLVMDAAIRAAASTRGLATAARMRPVTALLSALLRPVVRVGTAIEAGFGRVMPASGDPEAEREASAGRLREVLEAEADVTVG